MRHFIHAAESQGVLTSYNWKKFDTVESLHCDKDDCVWVVTTDQNWRQTVLAVREKCANVTVLTYRYERTEMQTSLVLGARAYCHALSGRSLLASVSRVIEAGGLWLPDELLATTTKSLAGAMDTKAVVPLISVLTSREKDVLIGILDGHSNKAVARRLDITERTVKEYVSSLLKKLGAKDRIDLLLKLGEFTHLKGVL